MSESVTLIAEVEEPSVSMELENTPPPMVIEVGIPGPPGPDTSIVTRTAAIDLSGDRIVQLTDDGSVTYADASDTANAHRILGVTVGAVTSGSSASVKVQGVITDNGWSWDVTKPIFLGANGAMTQTPPTTGILMRVAKPIDPTSLYIEIEDFTIR